MAFRELINLIGFELDEAAMRDVENRTHAMFENMKDFGKEWSLKISAPIIAAGVLAVNEFAQWNEEMAIVRQRIESTGGTAGKTAEELDAMSNKLAEGVKYSHDEILKGEEVFLKFGTITGETFDRATKAAIDFASANKMDVTSSAQIMGRALESPGEGMRRLAMMGIHFTKVEKKRLEVMVESGQVAKAQALILDKVEKSTGGVAKKVAEASSGFYKLKKSIEELQESFGEILIPYFRKFYEIASKVFEWFNKMSPEMKQAVVLFGAIAAAIPLIVGALGGLGLAVNGIMTGLLALRTILAGKALLSLATLGPWLLWAIAIAAIGIGLGLLTEDIIAFSKGKKSLVGELLGDIPVWWDAFVEQVTGFINIIRSTLGMKPLETRSSKYEADKKAIIELQDQIRIKNAKTPEEKGSIFTGTEQPFAEFSGGKSQGNGATGSWDMKPSPATMATVNKTTSNNITVNQQLPPGTPEQHKKEIKQFTEDIFNEHLNKHLRSAYNNFSVVTP
jgi:hypothetical protein